jgi:hypothetical protein
MARSPRRFAASSAFAMSAFSMLVAALMLTGCDAGKEAFLKGAQAEEKGDLAGAAPFYEEVCTRQSPLCDAARKREARLALKRAQKALDEEHYKDARAILDDAKGSEDARTAELAAALLALPELVQGVIYEDALAAKDKNAALKAMEGVASEPSAMAPKAKEWLDKNRPEMLLVQVKVSCRPAPQASCEELTRKLAILHPDSAEAREAKALAADNYKRLHPKLKEVENLLIQRVSVYDKAQKIELCKKTGGSDDDCEQRASTSPVPTLSYLENFWKAKLTEVDDSYYRKQFEARWEKASAGQYDPEPWPKP